MLYLPKNYHEVILFRIPTLKLQNFEIKRPCISPGRDKFHSFPKVHNRFQTLELKIIETSDFYVAFFVQRFAVKIFVSDCLQKFRDRDGIFAANLN